MDFIFEFLLEFLIQILGETLFELGLRSLVEPFRRQANPWLATIGYAIFGFIFGCISLAPFPQHMVGSLAGRWLNLIYTPVAIGLWMSWLGRRRAQQGQSLLRIDRFSYGYLFALCFSMVRFAWAD